MRRLLVILIALSIHLASAQAVPPPPCPAEIGYHRHWENLYLTRDWHVCRYGKQGNADVDDKAYTFCLTVEMLNICLTVDRYHPPGAAYDRNYAPLHVPELPAGFRAP